MHKLVRASDNCTCQQSDTYACGKHVRQLHIVMLSITLLPFIQLNIVIHSAACKCGPEWQPVQREFTTLLEWHVSFDSHEHQLQWPQWTAAVIVEQPYSGVCGSHAVLHTCVALAQGYNAPKA